MLHGKQPWSFRHIRLTLTRAVYFDEQMIPGRQPHFRVSRRGLSGKFWPSPRKTSAWKSSQPGAGVQRAPRTASSSSRESERGRITHPPAPNRGNAGWLHPTPIPQRLESASKNSGRLVVVRAPQRQKPRRRTRTLWPGGTRVAVPQLPSEATPGEGGGDSGGAAAPAVVRTDGRRRDQLVPCSLGLSTTSQQYFSLTTNQPPASSALLSEQISTSHQPPANRTGCGVGGRKARAAGRPGRWGWIHPSDVTCQRTNQAAFQGGGVGLVCFVRVLGFLSCVELPSRVARSKGRKAPGVPSGLGAERRSPSASGRVSKLHRRGRQVGCTVA
jgi:hypothetical protein